MVLNKIALSVEYSGRTINSMPRINNLVCLRLHGHKYFIICLEEPRRSLSQRVVNKGIYFLSKHPFSNKFNQTVISQLRKKIFSRSKFALYDPRNLILIKTNLLSYYLTK